MSDKKYGTGLTGWQNAIRDLPASTRATAAQPCPFCGQCELAQHLPTCWFLLRDLGASHARLIEAWNRRAQHSGNPASTGRELSQDQVIELLRATGISETLCRSLYAGHAVTLKLENLTTFANIVRPVAAPELDVEAEFQGWWNTPDARTGHPPREVLDGFSAKAGYFAARTAATSTAPKETN